jgi:hypothetical protein
VPYPLALVRTLLGNVAFVSSVLSHDADHAQRSLGGQRDRGALPPAERRVRYASAGRRVIRAFLRSHTVFKRAVHAPSDRKSAVRNWDLRQRGGGGSDMGDSPSAPNHASARSPCEYGPACGVQMGGAGFRDQGPGPEGELSL